MIVAGVSAGKGGSVWEGRRLAPSDRDSERANSLPPTAGTYNDDPCREGFVRSFAAGALGTHPSAEMPAASGIGEDRGWG